MAHLGIGTLVAVPLILAFMCSLVGFGMLGDAALDFKNARAFGEALYVDETLLALGRLAKKLDEAYDANLRLQSGSEQVKLFEVLVEDPAELANLFAKARAARQQAVDAYKKRAYDAFWQAEAFAQGHVRSLPSIKSYKDRLVWYRDRQDSYSIHSE
jgi:hypothetical protein